MADFDRRLASSRVTLDGKMLGLYVVEANWEKVVRYYPLVSELPFTEYLMEGVDIYKDEGGVLKWRIPKP